MNNLLTSDHLELDEILNQLFLALEKGVKTEVFEKLDLFWARLAMHIRAEHLHLFPAIMCGIDRIKSKKDSPVSFDTATVVIGQLRRDHNFFMRELLEMIKQMQKLHEPGPTLISNHLKEMSRKIIIVQKRLEKHNKLEEAELYGWGDVLLNADERGELVEKMYRELKNLPPRFRKTKIDLY